MIINLSHQKGGVGKSTLATNLAVELKAVIIDLDSQKSSVIWAKQRAAEGYGEVTVEWVKDIGKLTETLKKHEGKTIIIDSGGYDSELMRVAIAAADIVITPVAPSPIEVVGLQNYQRILREISKEQIYKTNVIINNADGRSQGGIEEVRRYVEQQPTYLSLMNTVICTRIDYKKAYGVGAAVTEYNPTGKAAAEIIELCNEIKS